MLKSPNLEDIYTKIVNRLRDEGGLSVDGPSSIASAIALGVATSVKDLWDGLVSVESSLSIDTAVGTELDRLGESLGVLRKQNTKASTLGYGPALVLKNNTGTTLVVPAGISVFPSKNNQIVYRTLSAASIPAYQQVGVDVEALGDGPEYNVSARALNSNNSGIPGLEVYNPRAIDSGSNLESDEAYRTRLYQAVNLRNPSSKQAIRNALSSLPGIRDIRIIENSGGAGTFDVLLIGQGSEIPVESVYQAEGYLAENAPVGTSYRVLLPKEVPVDVTCVLTLPTSQEDNRSVLTNQVKRAITDYINSLDIEDGRGSGEFIYSNLIENIGVAAFTARDYSVDVSVNDVPLRFGANYRPQLNQRLFVRRLRVD